MMLDALGVSRNDPLTELVVSCSDTNVLLILLKHFEDLPCCITFKTSHHKYELQKIHKN